MTTNDDNCKIVKFERWNQKRKKIAEYNLPPKIWFSLLQ